jgi:cell division septation protein DedD
MAESGVREIQLSGKQLVFLFMASVVLVVVVFLLGVSVGRGARVTAGAVAPTEAAATTEAPIVAPPGTPASAADLTYHDRLPGSGGPAKRADAGAAPGSAATPAATTGVPAPPAETSRASDPPPGTSSAPVQTPVSDAAATTKTPTPASFKPPAAPPGSWFVQVDSFRSKDLATALVAKLKGKGYDAFIVDVPKPLLHVRVGPYPERTAADSVVAQLKKDGFSSLVTH